MMLKMIKDRVGLSFKSSMSRTSQMEKRKRGKLNNMEMRMMIINLTKRADGFPGKEKG